MQDLYITFVNHLKQDDISVKQPEGLVHNLMHIDNKLKLNVEFFGIPFISRTMVDKFRQLQMSKEPPSIVVVGCALEPIKISNASRFMLEEYKVNLTKLVQPINQLHKKKTKVLWALQEPVNQDKLKPELHMITNEVIDLYNKAAIEVLYYSEVELWRSIRLVVLWSLTQPYKWLHSPFYAFDIEKYITLLFVFSITVAVVMVLHRLIMKWRGRPIHEYSQLPENELQTQTTATGSYFDLFVSLAKMALIMSYFFLCDRTNFFMKENKYYSEFSFWLPIGYVTVLGLFFTEDSKYTKVLHRDQLNEWKGYEQFCCVWQRGDKGIVFVTRPWKALFVTTDDDIREWWFRWKLDRYSMMCGMSFAVILLLAQRYNIYDDNNHSNLFSRGLALTGTLAAIMGIGCYIVITFLCSNELECSEIHSYIVFIPIVGYIVLRNISGVLRTRYSSLFAWFGEISLELFISQYHIWLAADTHGVLVLIPGYPVLNVMITSFIFVCASHEVHRLTKVLLPYAVPSDWKCVVRNFILFLAILVPIGINDGMF
ncbi:CAS1 domain-containing protein 1 [Asbolus verrucosus]|uniref:CAS1 domain-containing protein 1 n=1 Tax=Asbolus verrucosus TaxID=1661398 RepID=A0A482W464_ASBVE|nr:CAS1 domain-containing protein 1 [Asbolus verrucosus]